MQDEFITALLNEEPWDESLSDSKLLEDKTAEHELPERSWFMRKNIVKAEHIFVKRREKAREELTDKMPQPGEAVHIVMSGMWDYWHIPECILDQYAPGAVKEIHCATWAYNRQTLIAFRNQVEKHGCKTTFMVTRANKGRYPSEHYLLLQTIEKYNGTLIELNQHAKIYLINAQLDYYSIVGSANMTKNESLEQAVIINDRKTYDFYKSIFDHFKKTK